jgi:hypothetical protein
VFVRFPRPAVMTGRDGAERFPSVAELPLDVAVVRALRPLDPAVTLAWVQEVIALHDDADVLRARNATVLARPADVRGFFLSQFRTLIPARAAVPQRPTAVPIRSAPLDDPYGF